jgi:hypothetical protein
MNRKMPLLLAMAAAAALLAGCSAGGAGAAGAAPHATATRLTRTAETTRMAPPKPKPKPTLAVQAAPQALPVDPGAGSLRQTEQYPSTRDTAFRNAMYDLWLAVTTGKAAYARPSFFPEAAYAQVKAIAYPQADWTGRLWLDFELDVGAAHDVVGSHARLLRVDMAPVWEAAWVAPGYCYNSVGYWHINGARLVYLKDGQERSIGIASLISWRGVWYVVHFGGVIRPAVGLVDDPEIGAGYPGPAGGC